MAHQRTKTLPGASNRSSIFFTASHDKRNTLWKAFRKTVLEPHRIYILENAAMDKVPETLLELVEEMCQNLDRHEKQASSFRAAVAQGRGFGPSPIFPPDIVPPVNDKIGLSRCMEPSFDKKTLPPHDSSMHSPLFELPTLRPGLACGFSAKAFSTKEFRDLPEWITAVGTYSDYDTGQIQPGQAVHVPFLMFERTYGHARHEIEAAMNYCAMDGAAALHALSSLYDKAWPQDDWNRPASPVVFSCTVDDDVGIIHHHWIEDHGSLMAAPLCKFDLRDTEHFMHFLAWIEAIEQWAIYFLLPDVKEAISIFSGAKVGKALLTPVTIEQKNEKLKRSMKLAFDNIPWRSDRAQGTPLAVTSAMRFRSPKIEDIAVFDSHAVSSSGPVRSQTSEISTTNSNMNEGPVAPPSAPDGLPHPTPTTTDQSRNTSLSSPFTTGSSIERSRSPKRTNVDMLPPSRPDHMPRSNTVPSMSMSNPEPDTSADSETSAKADSIARSRSSATQGSTHSASTSIHITGTVPRSCTPAAQSPPVSAASMETIYVHHNMPRPKVQGSQQSLNPAITGLAIATEFPGVHDHVSKTTPATVIRYQPPLLFPNATKGLAIATEFPGVHGHVSKTTPATVIRQQLPVVLPKVAETTTTTSTAGKEVPLPIDTHAIAPPTKTPPPVPLSLSLSPGPPTQPPTANSISSMASTTSNSSMRSKRSLSSLRQPKRIRSPATPESITSTSTSPKNSITSTSSSTIRSKISNSFGIINKHTLSRPKRARMDNAGPPPPKLGDEPLPTPAYDKRRFQTSEKENGPGQTSAWEEHMLHERVYVGIEGANGNGSIAGSTEVRTPGTAGSAVSTTVTSPPSRNQTTTPAMVPMQTVIQATQSLTQAVVPTAGSSNYLPLRNYGGIPEGTKAVTLTAGAV